LPLRRGDTLLIPKNAKATEHLWVIITEIDTTTSKAVCVNVTTRQSHSDTTCILRPGDHRFIQHESVINFSDAREMPIDLVEQALKTKGTQFVCQAHDPCDAVLLARIKQGLIDSGKTPKGIKAHCKSKRPVNTVCSS
jgi:hypothetical protein